MTTQELPPPLALIRMTTGYYVSQAIYAVAKLGIADLLSDGPRRPDELAKAAGTDGDTLRRVRRWSRRHFSGGRRLEYAAPPFQAGTVSAVSLGSFFHSG